MKYTNHFSTMQTPQSEAIPGTSQVSNSAGGFAWAVDDWKRLDRFLILGSEGGTYYISEHTMTVENAEAVIRCAKADGARTVARIAEVSETGRAPKNDPALFALAICAGMGDKETRRLALEALPRVARIGTHLFHFLDYVQAFRGWGRGLREAIAKWYNNQEPEHLAYQLVKYRQRDGWTHRDALRLAHPKTASRKQNALYRWVTQGEKLKSLPELVTAYEQAQTAGEAELVKLIQDYGLTHEMVPTEQLNNMAVWEALLDKMPMTAMIRNLGKMTAIGLFKPMSNAVGKVANELADADRITKARVHPLSVLVALRTYQQGHGFRGSLMWEPVAQIVDALDGAFYTAFGNVEPMGKRVMLALDVSGSMESGSIAGSPLTPREGSAAMALVTAHTEPQHMFTAFSSGGVNFKNYGQSRWPGYSAGLTTLDISPRQRLDDVVQRISELPFGGTDCALPMLYALDNGLRIDTFVIYTDSETWVGNIHPSQALQEYRRKVNPEAQLVVVGMVSNGFSIADPNDAGMLDVVGFDTATPNIISEFGAGRL